MLSLQDPHAEEFEDKEWTFVIENVSTGSVFCVVALTVCINNECSQCEAETAERRKLSSHLFSK